MSAAVVTAFPNRVEIRRDAGFLELKALLRRMAFYDEYAAVDFCERLFSSHMISGSEFRLILGEMHGAAHARRSLDRPVLDKPPMWTILPWHGGDDAA